MSARRAGCYLLLLGLLAGCQSQPPAAETVAMAARPAPTAAADQAARTTIHRQFEQWRRQQVRSGRLRPADSCKPWRLRGREPDEVPLGLPDSSAYRFSFADLNQDGRLDGLMTFTPAQCDGGNGSMWVQYAVLALSGPAGYQLNDSLNAELARFAGTAFDAQGFYHLDSLGPNRAYATYYELDWARDGHCCPHIHRPLVFDFGARRRLR